MTVSTINSVAEFVTNGATKTFPFYFKFLDSRDLVVTYIDPEDVSTVLVMGTHYTVSGAGNDKGGSVTTTAVLPGPGKLIVFRDMEAYQKTSLRNQGKFLAETHEDVFDRLTMLSQQSSTAIKRALSKPFGREYFHAENQRIKGLADPESPNDAATKDYTDDSTAGAISYTDDRLLRTVRSVDGETLTQLPAVASRANKVMGFDANGQPIGVLPASGSGTELAIDLANPVDPFKGASMLGYENGDVAAVLRGHQSFGPSDQKVDQVSATVQAGPSIARPWSTIKALNIFVDPLLGSDTNIGGQDFPLKTIDAAIQKVPQNIYHRVRIFLLDGDYSGQTIRAFNYYVSPRSSSSAGFKIIGHAAVVDGQRHPIYTDDAPEKVLIGGGVISGIKGTEEFTVAGVTVKDGWLQAYDCHVECFKVLFNGGVHVDKIPIGGHYSTVRCVECEFDDVSCAIDAEGYATASFDKCVIKNIVEHPTESIYGRPIVARNFSKVYIKNSPTFYDAGPSGKRNTATNQSEITGAPYSHAAEDGFSIYRGWDASQLLLSGGTGRSLNNARGGGLALFGSGYSGAVGSAGDAHLNCGPSSASTVSLGHVDYAGIRSKLLTAYRTGDIEVSRSISFGAQGRVLANTLLPSTAGIYSDANGDVWIIAKNSLGEARKLKIFDFSKAGLA